MAVFTLPSFNVVFKIIKDSFGAPKNTTRQAVMDKYHFVFVRDRVGPAGRRAGVRAPRVPPALLPRRPAGVPARRSRATTVRVEGDRVIVRHALHRAPGDAAQPLPPRRRAEAAAREAVLDYGNAIKDLAAADIFTGDMLLKNFGVTRNGRVICYDYDELCLLSECRFRRLPEPTSIEEEFAAEPWFHVGERTSFPRSSAPSWCRPGAVRDAFLARPRRPARRGVLAGRAAAARRGRGVRRVPLPPLRPAQARPRPRPAGGTARRAAPAARSRPLAPLPGSAHLPPQRRIAEVVPRRGLGAGRVALVRAAQQRPRRGERIAGIVARRERIPLGRGAGVFVDEGSGHGGSIESLSP